MATSALAWKPGFFDRFKRKPEQKRLGTGLHELTSFNRRQMLQSAFGKLAMAPMMRATMDVAIPKVAERVVEKIIHVPVKVTPRLNFESVQKHMDTLRAQKTQQFNRVVKKAHSRAESTLAPIVKEVFPGGLPKHLKVSYGVRRYREGFDDKALRVRHPASKSISALARLENHVGDFGERMWDNLMSRVGGTKIDPNTGFQIGSRVFTVRGSNSQKTGVGADEFRKTLKRAGKWNKQKYSIGGELPMSKGAKGAKGAKSGEWSHKARLVGGKWYGRSPLKIGRS